MEQEIACQRVTLLSVMMGVTIVILERLSDIVYRGSEFSVLSQIPQYRLSIGACIVSDVDSGINVANSSHWIYIGCYYTVHAYICTDSMCCCLAHNILVDTKVQGMKVILGQKIRDHSPYAYAGHPVISDHLFVKRSLETSVYVRKF